MCPSGLSLWKFLDSVSVMDQYRNNYFDATKEKHVMNNHGILFNKNYVFGEIENDHENLFFFQTTVCWFSLDKLNNVVNLKMNVVFPSYKDECAKLAELFCSDTGLPVVCHVTHMHTCTAHSRLI